MRISTAVLFAGVLMLTASPAAAWKPYDSPRIVRTPNAAPCPQHATTLCVPLDASFTVVNFDGAGGNGPADPADPCQRNDDDVTTAIPLQFTFDLYGTPQTQVFINNNGNISFGSGYSTYTASGFPVAGYPMVAPFWADVDTRNGSVGDGVVYYRSDPHQFIVIWDHVGYFAEANDKLNTFQLIISDGTAAAVPGLGNNVCFCYDNMGWTTGSASGGSGGFGGVPATVGVNAGDGVNFVQLGRFDHSGFDYDGPGGASDGVGYLNNRTLCFSASASVNQPPVPDGFPRGDSALCAQVGQTLRYTVYFTAPELGQTVHVTADDHGTPNLETYITDGNLASALVVFTPDASQNGQTITVEFTATDDGAPPATTTKELHIIVGCQTPARPSTWGTIKAIYK